MVPSDLLLLPAPAPPPGLEREGNEADGKDIDIGEAGEAGGGKGVAAANKAANAVVVQASWQRREQPVAFCNGFVVRHWR